jgi:hypothetical protein
MILITKDQISYGIPNTDKQGNLFVCSREVADGYVEIYFQGDSLPESNLNSEIIPPVSCTAAQFYAELNKRNWLAQAESYVNSVAASQPLVYIWWNKSQSFVSDSPILLQAAQGIFGVGAEELRALIVAAQANSPTL